MKTWWLAVLAVFSLSACYSFSETAGVDPGQTAKVTLASPRILADGSEEPITVEGAVVLSSLGSGDGGATGILLEQRTKQVIGNFREIVTFDTVEVMQPDIRRLEVRHLSWLKSGLGAVVVGALAYTLYDRFMPSAEVR